MNQILVVYGSKKGATKEIAERVAGVIKKNGYDVDVSAAATVNKIDAYQGIVLGSSVYIGQWHKDVVKFVEKFEKQLDKKQVWIFSSGPTGEGDPLTLMKGWLYPSKLEGIIKGLSPVSMTMFHGALDEGSMNFLEKFMIKKVGAGLGDYRDWDVIEGWAENVGVK